MSNINNKVAVGYLRRSTTKQEASLDKQREVIEQHAAQIGCSIVRYYTDDGISGASGAHRPAFQEMVAKAESGKDFDCIICYDLSRFGRMDNDEAGHYRFRLRQAGVEVITVMESDRYANPDTAEILRPIEQIQHRAYLKKVSADVLGGMQKTASDGHWVGGDAPFGYKRMMCDVQRNVVGDLEGGAAMPRRQGFHSELRPQPTEAPTVQWLFAEYVSTRKGYKSLAADLNEKGTRTRNGNSWGPTTVKAMLENPAYIGQIAYGRRSSGKFSRVNGGNGTPKLGLRPSRKTGKMEPYEVRITRNPEEKWVVYENAHPAIVEREVWERAQAKMKSRAVTRRSGSSHSSKYALTGLVRCGHCGGMMWGKTTTSKHDGKVFSNVYYRCGKYESYGRSGCKPLSMPNAPLERFVESVIRRRILATPPGRIEKTAARQLGRLTDKAVDQKREMEALERQIKTATERYLTITDDHVAVIAKAKLDSLTQKAEAIRGQAQPAEAPKVADVEGQIQKVVAEVRKLSEMIRSGSPELKQQVYQTLIESIDLYFAPAEEGVRNYAFERGVIKFKQVAAVAATTCRIGRGGRI